MVSLQEERFSTNPLCEERNDSSDIALIKHIPLTWEMQQSTREENILSE